MPLDWTVFARQTTKVACLPRRDYDRIDLSNESVHHLQPPICCCPGYIASRPVLFGQKDWSLLTECGLLSARADVQMTALTIRRQTLPNVAPN